jgi:RNA polymerase sigma-70 factor (ECF subfamily)
MDAPHEGPHAWLDAARAGSPEALGQALEACRNYLLAIANRELHADLQAKGGASDIVQDTFLEAQKDFAKFTGSSPDELRAWLRALLQHRMANFVRHYRQTQKRGLERELPLDAGDSAASPARAVAADGPTPSQEVVAREQAEAVERILQRLPEDYRTVIRLRYQEDLAFEEIGRRMQRTAEAARKLWWRAIERLQDEMDSRS